MPVNENYTFEGAVEWCGQRLCVVAGVLPVSECPSAGSKVLVGVGRREITSASDFHHLDHNFVATRCSFKRKFYVISGLANGTVNSLFKTFNRTGNINHNPSEKCRPPNSNSYGCNRLARHPTATANFSSPCYLLR
ncbi:hypothetical protein TNCV_58111 [Trichonephila clavipes]|nr:hypothetical protein TNCV_58111 [Trichonephila clavipes]